MSPYPQLKGPHAQVHIPNSRGHTHSIACGLSVVFTIQANGNDKKNNSMPQSPIAKGLHRTTPYNTYRTFREISSIVWYDCCRTHRIFKAMYTTKTSARSDNIVGH